MYWSKWRLVNVPLQATMFCGMQSSIWCICFLWSLWSTFSQKGVAFAALRKTCNLRDPSYALLPSSQSTRLTWGQKLKQLCLCSCELIGREGVSVCINVSIRKHRSKHAMLVPVELTNYKQWNNGKEHLGRTKFACSFYVGDLCCHLSCVLEISYSTRRQCWNKRKWGKEGTASRGGG